MAAAKKIKIYEMLDTAQPWGSKGDLVGLGEADVRLLMNPADKKEPLIRLVGDPAPRDKARDCSHVKQQRATNGDLMRTQAEQIAQLTAQVSALTGLFAKFVETQVKAAEPVADEKPTKAKKEPAPKAE